jgi:DNA-binding transcriptional LysR family regulator
MSSPLDLRYVVGFLAIAEELHFGRAAARLQLAQPTLSQQLQRLEREIGVELVSRTSRDVQLTAAGQAFEREARLLLDQATRTVSAARETAAGRTGLVTVGFNFAAGRRVVTPTLRRMRAEFPRVTARLTESRTGPQLLAIADKKIDIGFVMTSPPPSDLASRPVITEEVVAFMSPEHALANRQVVQVRELARHPCALFPRHHSPALYDVIMAAADKAGVRLKISQDTYDVGSAAMIVKLHGLLGFCTLSRARDLGKDTYGWVRLVDPTPLVPIHAVWRRDASPALLAFLECMEAESPFEEELPAIAI